MSPRLPRQSAPAAALLACVLAACASQPKVGRAPVVEAVRPQIPSESAVPTAERLRRIVDLLGLGQARQARAEIASLLKDQPSNALARSLLNQIDKDPKALLGEKNYAYRLKAGETLYSLAARFLGDPMLFYALARYNDIAAPNSIQPGAVLRIPGSQRPAPAPKPPVVAARPPAPELPPADPAAAGLLRRAALDDMTGGRIDEAVVKLKQAALLDPSNVQIRADLERASRIQVAVRQRK